MHLHPDEALFSNERSSGGSVRLALLVCVLVSNSALTSFWGLAAVWAAGVVAWKIDDAGGSRLYLLGMLSVTTGSLILMAGWFMNNPLALIKTGLRIGGGTTWVLWFRATTSWPLLQLVLRRWRCPQVLLEFLDVSVAHGLILWLELRRRWEAAAVRLGLAPGQPRYECYGLILAGGVIRAFDRAIRLEESRALRTAEVLSPEASEVSPLVGRNLSVAYPDGNVGIQRASFSIARGEWIAIMGPSGSGKSTLLHAFVGLLPPTEGELYRFGMPLSPGRLSARIDRRVALVFQNPEEQLFGSTPMEDLLWGLRRLHIPQDEANARAQHLLDELHITHLAQRPMHRLSFGERKRVAFASALVGQPQLLLCDEPTSNLDPVAAHLLMTALQRAAGLREMTVVWVTHDVTVLPRRVRRVILLRDHRLVFDGGRDEALLPTRLAQAGLYVDNEEPQANN